MNALHVRKIAFDPTNPDIIFAGTRPAALFRSRDGGQHWQQLTVDMAEECANDRSESLNLAPLPLLDGGG